MGYEDNPDEVVKYVRDLEKSELKFYLEGYIQACIHIREALNKGRIDLLNERLGEEDTTITAVLEEMIELLDAYEMIVSKREKTLAASLSRIKT